MIRRLNAKEIALLIHLMLITISSTHNSALAIAGRNCFNELSPFFVI